MKKNGNITVVFFFGHAQLGRRGNRLIELSESSQPAIDPTSMMLFMEVQSDMMNWIESNRIERIVGMNNV